MIKFAVEKGRLEVYGPSRHVSFTDSTIYLHEHGPDGWEVYETMKSNASNEQYALEWKEQAQSDVEVHVTPEFRTYILSNNMLKVLASVINAAVILHPDQESADATNELLACVSELCNNYQGALVKQEAADEK